MSETTEPYMTIPGYDAWKLATPPSQEDEDVDADLEPCPCCGRRVRWEDVEIVCDCGLRMTEHPTRDEARTALAWNSRKIGYFLGGKKRDA